MISTGIGYVHRSLATITTTALGDIADMIHAAGENASKQISHWTGRPSQEVRLISPAPIPQPPEIPGRPKRRS